MNKNFSKIHQKLYNWYQKNHRKLPWRDTQDPYAIWISETMLQQTQVDTVIPYYLKFLEKYPTVKKLHKTSLNELLHLWEGLGYYSRARNLHKGAEMIVSEFNAKLPKQYNELIKIPGIGDYTASALLSIAYGQNYPALDGNAKRVYSRLFLTHNAEVIRHNAHKIIGQEFSGDINQAIMDLGSSHCLPKQTQCNQCPIQKECQAYLKDEIEKYPKKISRITQKNITSAAVIIQKNQHYLIRQRNEKTLLGGLWEFPTLRIKSVIKKPTSLKKVFLTELKQPIKELKPIGIYHQTYTHLKETLHAFQCSTLRPIRKPNGDNWKWINFEKAKLIAWPRVQKKIWKTLEDKAHIQNTRNKCKITEYQLPKTRKRDIE